ncbi:MAG: hypothetical protein ACHQPI_05595 [Thermoanaerobaculia bacterium]
MKNGTRPLPPSLLLLAAALLASTGGLEAQPLTITHLAGSTGGPGWFDGRGPSARFGYPSGVAVDGSGNLYVADYSYHTIRKVTPAGDVSTLAGLASSSGSADLAGSSARFFSPSSVAVDGSGNVFVADSGNHTIRKVTPAGDVSTLAGVAGFSGSADGTGSAARFNNPGGVAVDGSGNVYIADSGNHTIRKVTPAGDVSTLAGLAGSCGSEDGTRSTARFNDPGGLAVDGSGNVYVADYSNHTIRKVTSAGEVSTLAGLAGSYGSADGTGSAARFYGPSGVAADQAGNVYVADPVDETIRRVTPAGDVSTIAGLTSTAGSSDGPGSIALFNSPSGVAVDGSGTAYVADSKNHTIRKIVLATGDVSTPAGLAPPFLYPYGVAVDGSGTVYVADNGHNTICKVTPAGVVSTLAGLAGFNGSADGIGSAARFNSPHGLAADGFGNLFVADTSNNTIRQIVVATGEATTLAGLAGPGECCGTMDGVGSAARFYFPEGIATDGSGNLYVADSGFNAIRKIVVATGEVTTLAGLKGIWNNGHVDGIGSAARFDWPTGIAADRSGNVYVADYDTIRKIVAATGEVTTIAGVHGHCDRGDGFGSAASFCWLGGIATDGSGNLFVADGHDLIRKVVVATGEVTTLAGSGGPGDSDGTGSEAQFEGPWGVAVDLTGDVYIADTGNNCIRKGTTRPGLTDAAIIDFSTGVAGQLRQLDTWPRTASRWQWEEVRRPSASNAALSSTSIRNPTFTPDVPDLYIFRLTASDDSGAQSVTMASLTVTTSAPPPPALATVLPTAGFGTCTGGGCTASYTGTVGIPLTVALFRGGTPVTSGNVSWQIMSGSASPSSGTGLTFTFTPQTPGSLVVTATVDSVAAIPLTVAITAAPPGLLLSSNRVLVTVSWLNPYSGQGGAAFDLPQSDQFGFFYYTDPNNPEVFVKVLDFGTGSALCFVGGLTDFYYKVTFKSVRTGQTLVFEKPAYQYIGFVDNSTLKFAGTPGSPASSAAAQGSMTFVGALATEGAAVAPKTAPVVTAEPPAAPPQSLAFSSGRVAVTVDWRNPYSGDAGRAHGFLKADQFGFFYYTDPNDPEVFVKVLDFGAGSALVFVGGLTDFYYRVMFTVLRTGQQLVFEKPAYQYIGFVDNSTLKF